MAQRAVKVIASGLHRPNGLAILNGTLYIAEVSRISKIDNVEDALDNPPKPVPVYEDLPKDEANGLRFLGVGPDGKLYVSVGAPCNNCLPQATQAQIRRIDLEGNNVEAVALGVRNSLGFDWSPQSKQLYFTDNGRDWLSEDAPSDELNRVAKPGERFRRAVLLPGQSARQRIRLGPFVRRVHAAGRAARAARRPARHALLHRPHVSARL